MSERPWMPFYVNDFRMDTLDLKVDEIGAYVVMLMICWRRDDAALPNDMAWMKRSLKACMQIHGLTFNRIVPKILKRYFILGADDKWRNKRLCSERKKAEELSEKQSRKMKERWAKTKEINELENTNVIPSQSQSQRKKESKTGLSGKGKMRVPPHGAVSTRYGTIFIHAGTDEWVAYVADFRDAHGYQPEPNKHGGWWFNLAGETPPPPLKRITKDH